MKLDTRLPALTGLLIVISLFFPFAADLPLPLRHGEVVVWLEDAQAAWLLFGGLFTLAYVKPLTLQEGAKQFWLWAALWWLVLLGRSISWGRDFFPDEPRMLFRAISVILIGTLVLSLVFSSALRREIMNRLRHDTLPLWTVLLVVVSFVISDSVEHHRLVAPLFLHDARYQDLIEELYEVPFMVGLFLVAFGLMKQEKRVQEHVAQQATSIG